MFQIFQNLFYIDSKQLIAAYAYEHVTEGTRDEQTT